MVETVNIDAGPALRNVDYTQMKQFIEGLRPDSELFSGRKFFQSLLKRKGLAGVLDFIERAVKALDEQSELDPFYNFTSAEREIFNHIAVKLWSRRAMLSLIPGAYFVAVEGALGAEGMARTGNEIATGEDLPPHSRNGRLVRDMLHYSSGAAIAIVVGNEMHELVRNWKLEQVGDAVHELHQQLPPHQQTREMLKALMELSDVVEKLKLAVDAQNAQLAVSGSQQGLSR